MGCKTSKSLLAIVASNLILVIVLSALCIGLIFTVTSIQNKLDIYEEHRQQEVLKVKEVLDSVIGQEMLQVKINELMIEYMKELDINQQLLSSIISKTKKIDLKNAKNIIQANLVIYNTDRYALGSGTHIKINGLSYILTCGHLIDDYKEDDLVAISDTGDWQTISLVKFNKEKDLALFRFWGARELPYLEISTVAPVEGSEVIVIGNPDALRDVITEGIVARITKNRYTLTNKIYYGNSGGAVLYKGKIVGVISQIQINMNPPVYETYGLAVKLEDIKTFLEDI